MTPPPPHATKRAALSLDAHLPLDRRQVLARGQELPERARGTALLADVSGFTPLMEHLANTLGPQQGAEELTLLLNGLFAPLIAEVRQYGSSIIAFGGDALTCWFPDLTPPPRPPTADTPLPLFRSAGEREGDRGVGVRSAAACALAMQRRVAAFPAETPAGSSLSMHIAWPQAWCGASASAGPRTVCWTSWPDPPWTARPRPSAWPAVERSS